jgi:BA14K-like protein
MRFAVYGAVMVITLGSMLLSLDWLSAPMSPMVDTEAGLRAPPAPPPPPPRMNITAPATSPVTVAPKANIGAPIVSPKLVAPANPNVPASPGSPVQPAAEPPASLAAPEPQPQQPLCNIEACTAAYRSFTASDCTYQPSNGPRRLCTKQPLPIVSPGPVAPTSPNPSASPNVPASPSPPEQPATAVQTEPPASVAAPEPQPQQPLCNIEACTAAYRSFTASDCTYQPSDGPRRVCTKQALPIAR